MKKVIIFGDKDFAQMACSYFAHEDKVDVVGFTVNKSHLKQNTFCGKKVVEFEKLNIHFPPFSHYLFAPISDTKLREKIFNEGRKKGYRFLSYISHKCTNYAKSIGENCFIQEDNTLQFFTTIGNNVVLWAGNHIGHHSVIEDNVTITSHVVISGHCTVKKYAYLAVNSTVRDNVTIGEGCTIGMSASVIKNTEDNKVYIGIPAKEYVH